MYPLRERKAVSPVIATVILVAVAITVAVGVSYWMGGISSQYTQFEKVEIQTGYATYNSTTTDWLITMVIKNSGSADATINTVFLNDVPCLDANFAATSTPAGAWGVSFPLTGVSLAAGASDTVYVWIDSGYASLSSGTTINVKLHSAGGMDYIKLIRLP
ncbi:MAG: type IV pilin [Candidatus Bathyarchaeota archaeon]|nr:type IV pilin [Candidatus Bathyarchaeota archaeon]